MRQDYLERAKTGWNYLEQVRINWNKKELAKTNITESMTVIFTTCFKAKLCRTP